MFLVCFIKKLFKRAKSFVPVCVRVHVQMCVYGDVCVCVYRGWWEGRTRSMSSPLGPHLSLRVQLLLVHPRVTCPCILYCSHSNSHHSSDTSPFSLSILACFPQIRCPPPILCVPGTPFSYLHHSAQPHFITCLCMCNRH